MVNDGKAYIYVQGSSDNDYTVNYVYEIKADGEVEYIDQFGGRTVGFVNPDVFQIFTRTDVLGLWMLIME